MISIYCEAVREKGHIELIGMCGIAGVWKENILGASAAFECATFQGTIRDTTLRNSTYSRRFTENYNLICPLKLPVSLYHFPVHGRCLKITI